MHTGTMEPNQILVRHVGEDRQFALERVWDDGVGEGRREKEEGGCMGVAG